MHPSSVFSYDFFAVHQKMFFRTIKVSLLNNKCFFLEKIFMFPHVKFMFLALKHMFLVEKLVFHDRKQHFLGCTNTFLVRFRQIYWPKSDKKYFGLRLKPVHSFFIYKSIQYNEGNYVFLLYDDIGTHVNIQSDENGISPPVV